MTTTPTPAAPAPAPTAQPATDPAHAAPVFRTRVPVTAEALAAYRTAARTGLPPATGPAAQLASPAHPFVLAHTLAQHTVAALTADEDAFTGVVHLAQEIRTHHPLPPATDAATGTDVEVTVTAARREPRGTRIALTTRLTTPHGTLLAELTTAALLLGATRITPHGALPPTAHPGTTPDTGPHTLTHTLTPADVRAYAHAAGDLNPIHLDDHAARAAGFPSAIAHGMHLLALAAEEITDRHAAGDPTRITALGARFAAPVTPGTPLHLTLHPHDRGTVVRFTLATTTATATATAVKAGWATIAPAGE
ncbi:MaoC family dehydratase [Kitasatospora sp. NPDC059747]|uniref:MaoC family dehydratase n=1 Tax=Kitasatospora sp. NPDC059747 TaxID=3346930 RepID=UPI003665B3DE